MHTIFNIIRNRKLNIIRNRKTEGTEENTSGLDVSGATSDTALVDNMEVSILDRFAAWILIGGVFLLPLFVLTSIDGSFEFAKTIFLSSIITISALFWVMARLKTGMFVLPRNKLSFFVLVLLLAFFVATVFSPVFQVSFSGFVYEKGTFVSLLFLVILFLLSSVFFQKQEYLLRLYAAVFLSFALVVLFHMGRVFFGTDFLSFDIFTNIIASPVGKWNDVAIFGGLAAILSLLSLEFSHIAHRGMRTFLYLTLGASLALLSLVNFDLVWILVGSIALVTLVYNISFSKFIRGDNASRGFSLSSVAVLLISIFFLIAGNSLGTTIAQFVGISHVEARPSWDATFSIIKSTWEEGNLFFGSGPSRFSNQWLAFKPDGVNETLFWNTDFAYAIGLLPTFAVTSGIIGTLGWLLFLLGFLYNGVRGLFSYGDPTIRFYVLSSFVGALYLWIVSIFYVPNIVFFAFAFLFTGVFTAALTLQGDSKNMVFTVVRDPRIGFVSVLVLIIILVGLIVGGSTIVRRYLSLSFFQDGRIEFNNGNVGDAKAALEKAINAHAHDSIYQKIAEVHLRELNGILTRQDASIEAIRAEFQETLGNAIQAGRNAVSYDETNYVNWLTLGRVYSTVVPLNIQGAFENATESFNRAATLNPKSPAIVFERARMEAARGGTEEAKRLIEQALSMRSTYTDAIFLRAQLDINAGNVRGAVETLDRASLIEPNDVGLFFRLGLLKYSLDDYIGTIVALERAIALSPDYSNAKYFLGLAYYNEGRKEDAIREFERVQELNPDNNEVTQILHNMKNDLDPFVNIIPPGVSPEERGEPPINE